MNPEKVFTIAAFFCGIGVGVKGTQRSSVRLGDQTASFKLLGGIDNDPQACADFEYLTDAPALCADMHTVQPAEIRAVLGEVVPDCVFTSPPCKGFSGLLGAETAATAKYQKLNELVFRGLHLMCETWDSPPGLIVLENVPRITSRGAKLLEQVRGLLRSYGYLFHESNHDCGVIGGLAQHRKRFLMVARLPKKVNNFVYQPPKKRVRGCGEVLGQLPMPHTEESGLLHRLPRLNFVNWVRLAMIPAGGDWRDLPLRDDPQALSLALALKTESRPNLFGVLSWQQPAKSVTGSATVSGSNGVAAVSDPRGPNGNVNKVTAWDQPVGTITHSPAPSSGAAAVADPRVSMKQREWGGGPMGVTGWNEPSATVAGESRPSNGRFSVADPRLSKIVGEKSRANRHSNQLTVTAWEKPSPTIIGATRPGQGAASVADPRLVAINGRNGKRFGDQLQVIGWEQPANTVTGQTEIQVGAQSVVDPRTVEDLTSPVKAGKQRRSEWARWDVRGWDQPARTVAGDGTNGGFGVVDARDLGVGPFRGNTKGPYGVMSWEEAAAAVVGSACIDNGPCAVADPRRPPDFIPVIQSPHDGFWHRPMTTLELAALQGIPTRVNGKALVLAGKSNSGWRERIGNAVPEGAGCAIGESALLALLASSMGTWTLGGTEIWVRNDEGNDEVWAP